MDFFLMIKLKIHHDLIKSTQQHYIMMYLKTEEWAYYHEARLCKESGLKMYLDKKMDIDLMMVVEANRGLLRV